MKKLLVISTMIALLSGLSTRAVTVQENTVFPDINVIQSQLLDEDSAGIRDYESGGNNFEAVSGQTFTLGGSNTVRAITLKSHSTYADTWLTTGDEILDIWIGADSGTVSNNVSGATNLLTSVAITNMAFTAGNYYTFNLDSDVVLPPGDYSFQFQFQGPGTKNQWFVRRAGGSATNNVGGLIFDQTTNGDPVDFPLDTDVAQGNDLVFGLHSSVVGAITNFASINKTAGGEFPLNSLVATQAVRQAGVFLRHNDIRDSVVGQTFVLDEDTTLSQLTLGVDSGLTATNASNNLVKLWIGAWTGSGPGEAYLSEMIDLTDFVFANSHYRIDFSDVVVPAGTNVFQLRYLEQDASHSIVLKRSTSDQYPDGVLYARQYTLPSSGSLPFNGGTASGDLVFALHSAANATVAGTGSSFPADNVVLSNAVGSATQQMRLDALAHQTFGQTFTLASETTLDALTLKSVINRNFDSDPHEVEIWIGTFTNVNTVGTTYLRDTLDFAGVSLVSGDFYKIDLSDVTLPAGKYALQMQWTESNTVHWINWALGDNDGAYAGGNRQFWNSADTVLPFTTIEQANDDMIFALHQAVAPSGYSAWTTLFGLSGTNALTTANPDDDLLNNLYEYGLGGDPTNSADVGTEPVLESGSGGLDYLHVRRVNATNEISYLLETTTDLVGGTWTNLGYAVSYGSVSNGFDTVTNSIDTSASQRFIKLIIEEL